MSLKSFINKWLGLDGVEPATATPTTGSDPYFSELLDKYSLVDVVPSSATHGPFVVVTERNANSHVSPAGISYEPDVIFEQNSPGPGSVVRSTEGALVEASTIQLRERADSKEIGSTNPTTSFAGKGEYNTVLQGESGLDKFNRARMSDGVIASVLLGVKTPVFAGNWRVDPGGDEKEDKEASKFVSDCLMRFPSNSWSQILMDSMLSADFGFMVFEKVWENRKIDGVNRTVLKKLAPRHPADVLEIKYDKNGGPKSVVFNVVDADGNNDEREVKIEKLLIVTYQQEIGNLLGRSVIRAAYQHYYYKTQLYKIDAIQKERHGIGIPVIKLPPGFTAQDKTEANALGRNLRTNERAHIVLPPNWEIFFAKLEGNPVNALESIKYHDQVIRESVLAGFLGQDSATNEDDLSLFYKSTRFVANSICDAFNTYLVPDIIRYNYDTNKVKMPKLQVRQIGEQADNRTLSMTLRNMVGAGLIRPDDVLENYLRELFDLPPVDLATVRIVKAPQAGTPAGTTPNATPGTKTELPMPNSNPESSGAGGTGKENPAANTPGLPRQTPLPNIGVGGSRVGDGKGQR